MKEILKNKLRTGDVICNWDKGRFILLLIDIDKKDIKKVLTRIINNFEKTYLCSNKIEIKHNYYKLQIIRLYKCCNEVIGKL